MNTLYLEPQTTQRLALSEQGEVRPPEALQHELAEFLKSFPEVKGEEIPEEVWQAVVQGQSLTLAYSLHRICALEQELDTLRKRQDNQRRSTGSFARNAPSTPGDLIAMWWNEAR
ncbi:MAG: hypothetical protein HFE97_07510 [Oscillospiraceae bacterium]|nr:hypothetical protein [Oscillospiraceae bacterium]